MVAQQDAEQPSMASWLQRNWTSSSREDVRDTLVMLLLTSVENAAHTLFWLLAMLGHHPDVQQAVRAELAQGGESATLSAALRETLRLYPGGYAALRWSSKEQMLDTLPVPANCFVIADIYHMQRSPTWFERPEQFEPERFGAQGTARTSPAYLPFGMGPRVCIGKTLAVTIVEAAVAAVLRQREVVPQQPVPTAMGSAALQPAGPMGVLLRLV
jgi:cytochrome P450